MAPEFFVDSLREQCIDSAVQECVTNFLSPPGRKPDEALLRLSQWFSALSASDREMVCQAMQRSAYAAVFGVLCVIDGVRVIESETEKSEFELTAIRGGARTPLSPSDTFLHDLLRSGT